jgi:hypothetical protein
MFLNLLGSATMLIAALAPITGHLKSFARFCAVVLQAHVYAISRQINYLTIFINGGANESGIGSLTLDFDHLLLRLFSCSRKIPKIIIFRCRKVLQLPH